jgi:hypothetical protein
MTEGGVGSDAARRCPACGAGSHPERELCSRCGADLDTGRALPVASPAPVARGGGPAISSDRMVSALHHVRDRAVLAVLGVALGAALVVSFLLVTDRGPFAPAAVLPAAGFDPSAYADAPVVLSVLEAGSVPSSGGEEALLDGDATTAWTSSVTTRSAAPVRIVLILADPAWVTRLVVRNGDQADAAAYERAGRAKRVTVVFDGQRRVGVDLLDVGLDRQVIALPFPELTTRVEIEFDEAFDGTERDAIALSSLELLGWVALGDDRASALVRAGDRVDRPTLGPSSGTG